MTEVEASHWRVILPLLACSSNAALASVFRIWWLAGGLAVAYVLALTAVLVVLGRLKPDGS